jgi:flagellar basal-body rod modification protein FlgD
MGMNIERGMGLKTGEALNTDVRSVNNHETKGDSEHIENLRQKIGTDFTAAIKAKGGKKKNELGKDDFMKLMSAQLKHQDPISPMKNEQMAAQLAQFSALEQMMNVNQNLEKMAAGQKPSEHMIAASLIGKRVTTDSNHVSLEKDGQPEISFHVPTDTQQLNLAVVNSKGEVVREFDLGGMKQGQQSVRWDGKNSKAQPQAAGDYNFRLSAIDKDGRPVQFNTDSSGLVTGVTFEGGKSILLVDGKKVPIDKVGKIEAEKPAAAGVNGLTEQKQNLSKAEEPKDTSTQVAKNSLPSEITPEKIKSLLAAQGLVGGVAEEGAESRGEENKVPHPMWNPATN